MISVFKSTLGAIEKERATGSVEYGNGTICILFPLEPQDSQNRIECISSSVDDTLRCLFDVRGLRIKRSASA
jgi:hypothetical protein